jgi:hypothetical protein
MAGNTNKERKGHLGHDEHTDHDTQIERELGVESRVPTMASLGCIRNPELRIPRLDLTQLTDQRWFHLVFFSF